MGRLALKQILQVPKYINEMLIIRSQDQLVAPDGRSGSKFGSPFEMNLSGWSRSEPKPSIRELVEGPVGSDAKPSQPSRFGRVGSMQRIDLLKARSRAKLFMHITHMTGGLFSNWHQVSKSAGVYRDFLENRMQYELSTPVQCSAGTGFQPRCEVHRQAIEKFRNRSVEGKAWNVEVGKGPGYSRLTKMDKKLRCVIDETKIISKRRFVEMNSILNKYPIL